MLLSEDEHNKRNFSAVIKQLSLTRFNIPLLFIAVFALAIRLPACFSDLWIDEIWTLFVSNELNSPTEIFTKFLHSNNHHLNTFFLYLLGNQEHWAVYRIHSLVAGVGAVILAWFIAYRAGKLEAVIASLLTAGSYLMIHFSSEARGYALVIFFALATFIAVQRFAESKRWLWAICIWFYVILGFLSHLMYLHVFLASGIWLFVYLYKKQGSVLDVTFRLAQCFCIPIIFLGYFYLFFIKKMVIGGGPIDRMIDVLIKTFSYAGGGPSSGPVAILVSMAILSMFAWAIICLWQKGNSEWLFYLIVIFLSPAVALVAKQQDVLFVRYFLINIAFGFIATSFVLADLYRRGYMARVCVSTLIILFLVGNGINIAGLFKYGRGGYLEGLRYITDHTQGKVVTVSSDHDFRNSMLIKFYKRYLPTDKKYTYIPQRQLPVKKPMWVIFHRIGDPGDISQIIGKRMGNPYKLVKTIPYSDLSGWHWFLYQRQNLLDTKSVLPDMKSG